jgi:signal transduction histidine kinase
VPLSQVLSAALETARPLVEHAGHHRARVESRRPVAGTPTRSASAQVFANLLNNASKYTEPAAHPG